MSCFSSSILDSVQSLCARSQSRVLLNNISAVVRNVPIVINIEEDTDSKNVLFYPVLCINDELRNLLGIILEKDEVGKFIQEFCEIRG